MEILLRLRNRVREKDLRQQGVWALEQHLKLNVDEHKTVNVGGKCNFSCKVMVLRYLPGCEI